MVDDDCTNGTDYCTVHDLNRLDSAIRFELEQRIAELEAEVDKLREALEWYADRQHYSRGPATLGMIGDGNGPDWGNRARKALEQ